MAYGFGGRVTRIAGGGLGAVDTVEVLIEWCVADPELNQQQPDRSYNFALSRNWRHLFDLPEAPSWSRKLARHGLLRGSAPTGQDDDDEASAARRARANRLRMLQPSYTASWHLALLESFA